jgi:PAS domain S-box-containing protein
MGALIRAHDWSETAVGPVETWSPALRMQVSFLLANRFPMLLWWGPTFCSIYNDAYAPILGTKHPWALGRPVSECWSEIWDVLRPLIETPFTGGAPTWIEDFELELLRHGYLEEGHFTVAYSPVPDETAPRGIGGVVATVHEISGAVFGERRVAALRDLGSRAGEAKTAEQACALAAATLTAHGKDLPFVLLYLLDADERTARLAGAAGVELGADISPAVADLQAPGEGAWPLARALRGEGLLVVEDLAQRFSTLPRSPWSDPPQTGVVLPIPSTKAHKPAGLLVAGISPRLRLDEQYRNFLELLRTQVSTAIANARSYEEEKKRAEALAQIDRAKTAFFANVSHEFRTPLTLMLGPVENLLSRSYSELSPAAKSQLEVVNRNGLRLLRLVNTLLDFSRIEAGRVRALYQATDLPAFTTELASVFRAAVEGAGMQLKVDCPPLAEPVFVDRDMWEKIVLNLLSNAFKFTFAGEIGVSLRPSGRTVQLEVRDTGTGVPAAEMPRLFERFHRVENARGRTHEGSGIGLALVQELVKLHGGSIAAHSAVDRGTAFTITLPLGSSHLPSDQIGESRVLASTSTGAGPYVEEALRWLPDDLRDGDASELPTHYEPVPTPALRSEGAGEADDRPCVLVADDNADMRTYVVRLLAEQYRVVSVADGEAAVEAVRKAPPDLVLTDVMMPRLDGFGVLRELRADPRTHQIPVVMLSARAGEESRVDGMQAGADDYLVKPFSARELLARVSAHLQMARLRREAASSLRESEARFRHMADSAPVMVWVTELDGACSYLSKSWYEFTGQTPETGLASGWSDAIHPDDRGYVRNTFQSASRRREAFRAEYRLLRSDGQYRWVIDTGSPRTAADGAVLGYIGSVIDISDRKQVEDAIQSRTVQYETLLNRAPLGVYLVDADFRIRDVNPIALPVFGDIPGGVIDRDFDEVMHVLWHRAYADEIANAFRQVLETGESHVVPERAELRADRRVMEYYEWRVDRITMPDGRYGLVCYFRDISAQVNAREALKESDRRKDEFLATLAHELRNPLAPLRNSLEVLRLTGGGGPDAKQLHEMMGRQVSHMVRLVDDLLELSRISRGQCVLKKERAEVATILRHAVEISAPLVQAGRHRLDLSHPDDPVLVEGDVVRLAQVFANLINNAAKYSEPGGRITVSLQRAERDAVVSVQDTGIGIPSDMLGRVFDMFAQISNPLRPAHDGLGIGLNLVRSLVTMHGGSVEARSEGPGYGSEFIVRIPVCEPAALPDAVADPCEQDQGAGARPR